MSDNAQEMQLYLLKLGELTLKGKNRKLFDKALKSDIQRRLKDIYNRLQQQGDRYYLSVPAEKADEVEEILSRVPGLYGFSRAFKCEKDVDQIRETAIQAVKAALEIQPAKTFKVETRRLDKSFPVGSYEMSREIGGDIWEAFDELEVDVRKPELKITIEIRQSVHIHGYHMPGQRGLPVSSSGTGLLLLSGGLDSPVAGYLMAKRGLNIEAVYFHTPPYTSKEAEQKVKDLAKAVSRYSGKLTLHMVPFTESQIFLKKNVRPNTMTLHMRVCMMILAERIANKRGANCLITGESLGQVASQTPEAMRYTPSKVSLPVFRPLIAIDKEDIVTIAKKIDTYETAILPYDDCCTIFSPPHPMVKPKFEDVSAEFDGLDIQGHLDKAIENTQTVTYFLGEEYIHGE